MQSRRKSSAKNSETKHSEPKLYNLPADQRPFKVASSDCVTKNFSSESYHKSIPSPNPHPGRGVYGFALYLFTWIFLIFYLLWALLPHWLLVSLHLTYLPSKYWAVAVPLAIPVGLSAYIILSFAINLVRFRGLFTDIEVLDNDFLD